MTPYELRCRVAGVARREERLRELFAWHACHTINIHLKKGQRLTPDILLGRRKPGEGRVLTPEEYRREEDNFQRMAERFANL